MSMSTSSSGPDSSGPGQDDAVSQIHSDIENTREELEETIEALTGKFDVKAQAEKKTEELKSRVGERIEAGKHNVVDALGSAGREVVAESHRSGQRLLRSDVRVLALFVAAGVAAAAVLISRSRRKRQ
ncbi:DUF3618 domain-containing protein [Paeniglutamicibacter antarcticus]|uniref:DUF3618 domain-containing protein n=1 Tax=Arthrobacter terrae TaxID=2935737 RepID=A0A931CTE8_9MICC|nr:DUF3618 domain-containing protein [Arthrobacter terrae]MBG0740589.1 DUF3618 domain-containing protein [Arthrobacter terrae]